MTPELPPYRGGCTPGLKRRPDGQGCRRDCLHRALVQSYRDARDARDALRESDTPVPAEWAHGGATVAYQLEADDFAAAWPPITFKQWLIDHKREAQP